VSEPAPRVLVLADSRSFHTERYVAELCRQGCETRVASLEHGTIDHYALARRGPFRTLHYSLAAAEVRRLVDEFRPHVVNPHFASGYGFLAARARRKNWPPILLNLWGSDILIVPRKTYLHRLKTRLALEAAACVVGDSEYLLSEASRIGSIRQPQVIVWGPERRFFGLRREGAHSGPLRIIVPRPHEEVYNNLFILRALAPLIESGAVVVTFPAFGGLVDRFRSAATSLIERGGLKLYEKQSRDDYMVLLAGHDVYLSAALSDSSPASLLEAMGLGLIPVVGDIPGVREWVNETSGFRFDLTRESDLRETVLRVKDSRDDLASMRQGNQERVRREATFEDGVARTVVVMKCLAGL